MEVLSLVAPREVGFCGAEDGGTGSSRDRLEAVDRLGNLPRKDERRLLVLLRDEEMVELESEGEIGESLMFVAYFDADVVVTFGLRNESLLVSEGNLEIDGKLVDDALRASSLARTSG